MAEGDSGRIEKADYHLNEFSKQVEAMSPDLKREVFSEDVVIEGIPFETALGKLREYICNAREHVAEGAQ